MKTKLNFANFVSSMILPSLRPLRTKRNQSFLRRRAYVILPSAVALLAFVDTNISFAGSATWGARPATGNWSTSTNWTPATTPNGPNDIATFATSNTRFVAPEGDTQVNSIVFNPGASPFTIAVLAPTLTISGAGVTNNSGITQNFAPGPGVIEFLNAATAGGSNVSYTVTGLVQFSDNSTADNSIFTNKSQVRFSVNSTAANVVMDNLSVLIFEGTSTAGNGTFTNDAGGFVQFTGGTPTGGNASFTNPGGAASGEGGGFIVFNAGTAGNATFVNNGGAVSGALPGEILFNPGDAGNATLIANGGSGGGDGGLIVFSAAGGLSTGGTARMEMFGNGNLDISQLDASGLTTGSIEGNGLVFLGARNLTVGTNNLSTTFSGLIQDGGISRGTGGSLTKTGTGIFTLSAASTYTGGTTVNAGTLLASNTSGSATGSGAVIVSAGTLGGSGIVSGAVTVGTGNGTGATLAPAGGTRKQATLTSQGALTFKNDATYTYTFKAKGNKARTDKVVAMGVTINSGATFVFHGTAQGTLQAGLVLTVISNTSATPINGTFSNLSDGAILTANGNNFQASYEGGDGNDLTLTVVP